MFNMLGTSSMNFWNPITALIDTITNLIGDIGAYISAMFYKALFWLWSSVAQVLDCLQILFQMFAGVVPVVYKSTSLFANSGNLIMDIIMHPFVYEAFIKVLIMSFFLLIIFTFIAVVKNEYSTATSEAKGNSKGAIIGKSLKAFLSFFLIPMVCVFGIIASTYVLQALDYATSPNSSTIISNKLFLSSAYSANRARTDEKFYQAMLGTEGTGYQISESNLIFAKAYKSQEDMASAIDDAFDQCKEISAVNSAITKMSVGDRFANYVDSCLIGTDYGIEKDTYFNCKNASMVFYFYDLASFNWIVALFSIFFLAGILVSITLGAAVRLYELAILFIVSPAIISILPLDDGPFKTWKKKFVGKVIMVFAPVVALNLYFILLNTLLQVDMMGTINSVVNSGMSMVAGPILALLAAGGVGAIFLANIFDLFIVLAGAMVCKDSIKWLGDMIGGEDITGAGDKLKSNVSDFVKNNAAMAVGIGAGKFAAGKLTDVSKSKLEAHSQNKENKNAGKAQLSEIGRSENANINAINENNAELQKMSETRVAKADASEIIGNHIDAMEFAENSGLGEDAMHEMSTKYNESYQQAIQGGASHEEAKAAAFGSIDKSNYEGLSEGDTEQLQKHLAKLNFNRMATMSQEERDKNLQSAKSSQLENARRTADAQRKAVLEGNGEDESLEDINEMLKEAPKIAKAAALQYSADYELAKNSMSDEDFKEWKKEHKYDKYGGEENYKRLKELEKKEKKVASDKKKKEFKMQFKDTMKESMAQAKKEREKNKK
ncbi:MAG: MMCAP2_0566 family conjugal transfer protein [Christensenellales bacterium]